MSQASLVLLHGFTGAPSFWDPVLDALPAPRRVIRPALVGHRGGPLVDERTSWDSEVARLGAIVDIEARPHARGTVLCGYSLGARLALAVTLARPSSVARLVLVSGSAGIDRADERTRRRAHDDALAVSLVEHGLASFVERWESLPLFATQRSLPDEIRAAHRARRLLHEPGSLAASLAALSKGRMPWLLPHLGALDVDVVLLCGEADGAGVASAEEMAAAIPRARVVRVSGAGHDLCLERPSAVASELSRDATRHAGPAAARGLASIAAPPLTT